MATSLRTLVSTKGAALNPSEFNLEKGRVWSWVPGQSGSVMCFCWCPPSAGVAVIEVWGAGGSSSRMCCCGYGLPGNAGAFSRKCICFSQKQSCCTYVCGMVDHACRQSELCFRGCSRPGVVCWRVGDAIKNGICGGIPCDGCICAQGGRAGPSVCAPNTCSALCCFGSQYWCVTKLNNENCGIVCNIYVENCGCMCECLSRLQYDCCFANCWGSACCMAVVCPGQVYNNQGPVWNWARGYGGDQNCCGHFSCGTWLMCTSNDNCCHIQYLATPAGQYSRDGGVVVFGMEQSNEFSNGGGSGMHQHLAALSALTRHPTQHIPWAYCWGYGGGCGCYEDSGCIAMLPPGHPGAGATFCPDLRDTGKKGGPAAVRIKFITG